MATVDAVRDVGGALTNKASLAFTKPVSPVPAVVLVPAEQLRLPERLAYAPRIGSRLRVVRPFDVVLSEEEGTVVAAIPEITEFGYGSNFSEALEDLGKTLAELYFSINDAADRLSDDLLHVRALLNNHIAPVLP